MHRSGLTRFIMAAAAILPLGVAACADRAPVPGPTAENPCPQWTAFPASRHDNEGSPYLGCISAWNLRNMVANPADLQQGRPTGPASGAREAAAVSDYMQRKVRASQSSSGATASSTGSSSSGGSSGAQ